MPSTARPDASVVNSGGISITEISQPLSSPTVTASSNPTASASGVAQPSFINRMAIAVAAAIGVHVLLSRTVLGRFIYAHGDNPEAARLAGLPTRPLTMLQYALCAGVGYVGGVVMIAQTSLMHLQVVESTLIFDVIMVVVLGGVSLTGGRGNVMSVIAGTLLIGVLLNGMTILDMDVQTQNIVKGIVLLVAIVLDAVLYPRDEETSKQGD